MHGLSTICYVCYFSFYDHSVMKLYQTAFVIIDHLSDTFMWQVIFIFRNWMADKT